MQAPQDHFTKATWVPDQLIKNSVLKREPLATALSRYRGMSASSCQESLSWPRNIHSRPKKELLYWFSMTVSPDCSLNIVDSEKKLPNVLLASKQLRPLGI